MIKTRAGFRDSAARRSGPLPEDGGAHPTVEEWIAYRCGQVPEADERPLQRHLAECRECVALLLDLESFLRPPRPEAVGISEFEVAAARRAVLAAVRRVATRRRWYVPATLAASLLVGGLGLSIRSAVEHRRTVEELTQPQANVPILDLWPDPATRGGWQSVAAEVPAEADSFILILNLADPAEYPDYEVELVDPEGEEIWRRRGFRMSAIGSNFTVSLSRHFLPPGEHAIRLHGVDGKRRVLLEEYPIRIP